MHGCTRTKLPRTLLHITQSTLIITSKQAPRPTTWSCTHKNKTKYGQGYYATVADGKGIRCCWRADRWQARARQGPDAWMSSTQLQKQKQKRAQHLAHSKWQGRPMRTAETFNGPSDCIPLPWRWRGGGLSTHSEKQQNVNRRRYSLSDTLCHTNEIVASVALRPATRSMGRPGGQPPALPCRCCWAKKQTIGHHAAFLLMASW